MANIKSQIKRNKQNEKARVRNKIVRHANFHGAQFHPERSSRAGQRILANLLALA